VPTDEIGPKTGPTHSGGDPTRRRYTHENPTAAGVLRVELGGLEPPTSWVRSRRRSGSSYAGLQGFYAGARSTRVPGDTRSLREFSGVPSRERLGVMKLTDRGPPRPEFAFAPRPGAQLPRATPLMGGDLQEHARGLAVVLVRSACRWPVARSGVGGEAHGRPGRASSTEPKVRGSNPLGRAGSIGAFPANQHLSPAGSSSRTTRLDPPENRCSQQSCSAYAAQGLRIGPPLDDECQTAPA
jgi:hypothetical protein